MLLPKTLAFARLLSLCALLVLDWLGTTALTAQEYGVSRITVVDSKGSPVAGARVEVLRYEGADASYINLDYPEKARSTRITAVATPKSGSIGIQLPVALPYRIRVDVPPYAIEYRKDVFAGSELTISLRDPATLTGVVRDKAGAPLAAERVMLNVARGVTTLETKCAADGSFRFDRLMPVPSFAMVLTSQAGPVGGQRVNLASGTKNSAEFILARGNAIHGSVHDKLTGSPIQGARIYLGPPRPLRKSAYTDANGNFTMQGAEGLLAADQLYIEAPGYCAKQVPRPKNNVAGNKVDFQLERGITVSGRIVGLDGNLVANCYVAGVGMSYDVANNSVKHEVDWYSVRTNELGQFTIAGLRPSLEPALLVRRDFHATLVLPIPAATKGTVDLGDIPLRPRRILQGTLRDAAGNPIAGKDIHLKGCNADAPPHAKPGGNGVTFILEGYVSQRRTTTDSKGRFYFGDLAAGRYGLMYDETTSEFDVEPGRDPEPLNLRL